MKFENKILNEGMDKDIPKVFRDRRKTDAEKLKEREENNERKLRDFFGEIFDNNEDPEKRFAEFTKNLQKFLIMTGANSLSQEDINQINIDIKSCCLLKDKEMFMDQGIVSLARLIDWQRENEGIFEENERKAFIENSGFIPLNEMLSYGKHGESSIHIHVAPSNTLSVGTKLSLLKDGFRNLQEVLKKDEKIKEITASSWIVATESGRSILEKFGFTVVGEISPEMKEKFFKSETRPVGEAFINREDFLKQNI